METVEEIKMYIPADKLGKVVGNMNKVLNNVHITHNTDYHIKLEQEKKDKGD